MKVFLNPGHHPGIDPGAVNRSKGVVEANIVRDIAKKVAVYLDYVGIQVESLQSDNLAGENPTFDEVCGEANAFDADLFVSIHCNSAESKLAKGTETLIYSFGTAAEKAAECIQKQIVESIGTEDRGVKERPNLLVLKYTKMPAVLVETAFISNADDVWFLMYEQDEIARAIARGITDYFKVCEEDGC